MNYPVVGLGKRPGVVASSQPVSFAMIQSAMQRGASASIIRSLSAQYNALPAQRQAVAPLLNPTRPYSFDIWYGVPGSQGIGSRGFAKVGTFTESTIGSVEPIAFAMSREIASNPDHVFYAVGYAGSPEPFFILNGKQS